jgi:hypothetical protein
LPLTLVQAKALLSVDEKCFAQALAKALNRSPPANDGYRGRVVKKKTR